MICSYKIQHLNLKKTYSCNCTTTVWYRSDIELYKLVPISIYLIFITFSVVLDGIDQCAIQYIGVVVVRLIAEIGTVLTFKILKCQIAQICVRNRSFRWRACMHEAPFSIKIRGFLDHLVKGWFSGECLIDLYSD